MRAMRWRSMLRWLERALFIAAALAFGRLYLDAVAFEYDRALAKLALYNVEWVADESPVTRETGMAPPAPTEAQGASTVAVALADAAALPLRQPTVHVPAKLVGELSIPRLNLSTVVLETDDPAGMRHGAGHLRGTPLPWQRGNSAIAGHRDSAFRLLGQARRGDEIRLVTPHGTLDYAVTRAFAVNPEDVWVLDGKAAALTLITCFPFRWVGTAPERWIVQADRLAP